MSSSSGQNKMQATGPSKTGIIIPIGCHKAEDNHLNLPFYLISRNVCCVRDKTTFQPHE
jgi:hypothetical protein